MFVIEDELKKLPPQPGVYIMRSARDEILYVGKAVNLHNRVRSYFRRIVGRGPQIAKMVEQIDHFEYIVTDSELEALVLENNLIKEHKPRYNTRHKHCLAQVLEEIETGIFITCLAHCKQNA